LTDERNAYCIDLEIRTTQQMGLHTKTVMDLTLRLYGRTEM
jgi:hypothetical protein